MVRREARTSPRRQPERKSLRPYSVGQPIEDGWIGALSDGLKLHVVIPSRRLRECETLLVSLRELQTTDQVAYTVVCDDDDAPEKYAAIAVPHDTKIIPHESKIAACNVRPDADFDILAVISDDMTPIVSGWDKFIIQCMALGFPSMDGAIHLNDGFVGDRLCTIPILGRPLLERIGYVYHPDYKSLCCDNEQMECLNEIHRMVYVDKCVIRHDHYVRNLRPLDDLYRRNESIGKADKAVYLRRKGAGWPGFARTCDWSILIPTIPQRAPLLRRLLNHLRRQIDELRAWKRVEILTEMDRGKTPRGDKRNRLLEKSTGAYVSFIDDDDMVSDTHIRDVLQAIESKPDCVTFPGFVWRNGTHLAFDIDLKYPSWRTIRGGMIERYLTHLCPVRREFALAAKFPEGVDYGEDFPYAEKVRGMVRSQVHLANDQYFYFEDRQPSDAQVQAITGAKDVSAVAVSIDPVHPKQARNAARALRKARAPIP